MRHRFVYLVLLSTGSPLCQAHQGHVAALSGLNERLASAPAAADLFVKRARLYLHAQAYGPATADARKALELDSGHPDARLCLARIWSETDRLPEALEVLDRRHLRHRLRQRRQRFLLKSDDGSKRCLLGFYAERFLHRRSEHGYQPVYRSGL